MATCAQTVVFHLIDFHLIDGVIYAKGLGRRAIARPQTRAENGTTAYRAERDLLLKRFGANLRRLRTAGGRGLSQERLADVTEMHRTAIGKLELGEMEPRLSTLLILADGLGVGVADLLDGISVPAERRPAPQAGRGT